MVVSINPEPHKKVFQSLLDNTVSFLQTDSKSNQSKYLTYLGNKLEAVVADVMKEKAKGTPFENSIELVSGQKFPDIIAKKYYGVEVKTTKQNHWITTGNSVMEGTRVDNIERIYMLFGKIYSPIDFKYRPYEECLAEVVVTHSPRYLINMDLAIGQTIFDKLKIPYDSLRTSTNPVKPIIDYYRQFLEPGEEVWWLDQDEPKSTGLIIKLWNNLTIHEKNAYRLLAMIFFPEIFSGQQNSKFDRLAVWLVNTHGIVCRNVRDIFTAGGQGQITWKSKIYTGIPQIIIKMIDSLDEVKKVLNNYDNETLSRYWKIKIDDKYLNWVDLVVKNTKYMRLPFNLKEYLLESRTKIK